MKIKQFLYSIYDFAVPRFVTEDVALIEESDRFVPVMPLSLVEHGEVYDGIATLNSFVWLGRAWFGKQIGDVRPFELWGVTSLHCNNCSHDWVIVHVVGKEDKTCPNCGGLQVKTVEIHDV